MDDDPHHYRIEDSFPDSPLPSISPVSARAWALLARSRDNPVLQQHFLQVSGAVSMMKGLDYHHDNFMRIIGGLARGDEIDESPLFHEAVAYVNRGGQFHYFARSRFVKGWLGTIGLPKIDVLKHFRDKAGSHRSFDLLQAYDDPQIRTVHARSLSEFGSRLFIPKQPLSMADLFGGCAKFWGLAYLVFHSHTGQQHKGPHEMYELVIERDHSAVMNEAYAVFERLLTAGSRAAD